MLLAAGPAEWMENIGTVLEQVFGGDTPQSPLHWHQVAARAVVIYLAGLFIVRIGKSRLIARITALDIIVGFILGSLLARGITGNASISGTMVASAAIVASHWVFTAIACRWHWFGTLLKGRYIRPLIIDGQLQYDNLRRSHLSEHDVMEELRLHGLEDLSEVARAYKERNGEISIIKKKPAPQVVEIAVREGVQTIHIEFR
jgi:uncharacterized membrane protein YcaP (DUF421 family)